MSSDSALKTSVEGTKIEGIGEDFENIRSGSQKAEKVGIVVESNKLSTRIEVHKTSVLVEKIKDEIFGIEDSERSDITEKLGSFCGYMENQGNSLNAEKLGKEIDDVKEIKEAGKSFLENTSLHDHKETEEKKSSKFETGQTLKNQEVEQSDANLETLQLDKVNEGEDISAQDTFVPHDSSKSDQNKIEVSVLKNGIMENSLTTNQKYDSGKKVLNLEKDQYSFVKCEKRKIFRDEESISEPVGANSTARQTGCDAEDIKLDDTLMECSNNIDNVEETQNSENGTNSFVSGDKNHCQGSNLGPTLVYSIPDRADNYTVGSKSSETLVVTSHNTEEDQIAETNINGLDPAIELQPQISENETDSSKLLVVEEIECNASIVKTQETDHDISMMDIDEDTNHDASKLQSHFVETGANLRQVDNSSFNQVLADNTLRNGAVMECNASANKHSSDNVNIVIGKDGSLSVVQERDAKHDIICMNLDIEEKTQVDESESLIENNAKNEIQFVSYDLLNLEVFDFSFSDLVWGKVKSHPWWPGQIFDPSDASKLASKYRKKDAFLIAYYGDKTFAWCDVSQLKPFYPHFSQLEKLCSSDTFLKGINDILIEVSRRIVLGMACSCLPTEDYSNMKYQKIENAGIRGGNIEAVLDKSTIVNYFQPDKLVEYIKTLSLFPNCNVSRLEFATAQSQLKAFYHSKGYSELPVFKCTGGVMEIETETNKEDTMIEAESSLDKHDEKKKSTAKLTKDRIPPKLVNNGKRKAEAKVTKKLIISSDKKHNTTVESDSVDLGTHKKITIDPVIMFEDTELKSPPPPGIASSFKIGEFIKRAASNLTGVLPTAKCHGEMVNKKDDIDDFDMQNQNTDLRVSVDCNSTYEMFSQLCIAAIDPMNEYSFVTPIVEFYTEFRNFCVSRSSISRDLEFAQLETRRRGRSKRTISRTTASSEICSSEDEKTASKHGILSQITTSDVGSDDDKPIAKRKRGRPKKAPQPASPDSSETKKPIARLIRNKSTKENSQPQAPNTEKRKRGRPKKVITDIVASDLSPKDSYCSDTGLLNEKTSNKSQTLNQYKRRKSTGQSLELQLGTLISDMKHKFSSERSIISVDEKIVNEHVPTSLFLNFSNAKSLPSETDLIRKFSRYGPLKEAETEVLRKTNQAKVVFKRRFDADNAFSSAGKYSIFGPELLSYQLKPWTPKSFSEEMPEEIHDIPIADNQDATEGKQETVLMASSAEENHDSTLITTVQDDKKKCDVELTEESNMEHSDQVEAENDSIPMKNDAETKESMPETSLDQTNQVCQNFRHASSEVDMVDSMSYARPIVECNLKFSGQAESMDLLLQNHVPEIQDEEQITKLEDQNGSKLSALQSKLSLEHALELSEQAEVSVAPDNMEVEVNSDIHSSEVNQDNLIPTTTRSILHATSTIALLDRSDNLENSDKNNYLDEAPVFVKKSDDVYVASAITDTNGAAPLNTNDSEAVPLTTDGNVAAHVLSDAKDKASAMTAVHVAAIDKSCDLEIPEQVEAERDSVPMEIDSEHVSSLRDQHDLASITLKDKHDAAHISEDTLRLSEQAEGLVVSNCMKIEVECSRVSVQENQEDLIVTATRKDLHATSTIARIEKNDNVEHSEKSTAIAVDITEDNKSTTEVKTEGGGLQIPEQVEHRAIPECMKIEVKVNLVEVSEQMEPGLTSEATQVEVDCGDKDA